MKKTMSDRQKELDVLSSLSNQKVLISVASCSETHFSTLEKLSNRSDITLQSLVARNKATSSKTLDKMVNSAGNELLAYIVMNKNLYSKTLDKILNKKSITDSIKQGCLKHPNISSKTLYKFRWSNNVDIILQNPKADSKLLEFAYDCLGCGHIYELLVQHPNSSLNLLKKMSSHSSTLNYVKTAKDKYIKKFCQIHNLDFSSFPKETDNILYWSIKDIDTYLNFLITRKNA